MCPAPDAKSLVSICLLLLGSLVSIIGVFNNSLLFFAFLRSSKCFKSYFHFLLILSLLDIIISACYVPVIFVDSLKDWLEIADLARFWWTYFVYLLTLTSVAMTASCLVLTCASFERYLVTINSTKLQVYQNRRSLLCLGSLFIAILSKGGIVIELDVYENDDLSCKGTVLEKYVDTTPLSQSFLYGTVCKFWLRNLITVFAPFVMLTLINLKTILQLKKHLSPKASLRTDDEYYQRRTQSKTQVRAATQSLLFLCLLYLLSNLPNVIISSLEFTIYKELETTYLEMYLFSTDLISFLVVVACALRLPIYLACNAEIRQLVQESLCSLAHRPSPSKLGSLVDSSEGTTKRELRSFEQFL